MVHLRVADAFLDNIDENLWPLFIVGNIGPDCGDPNEDPGNFNPPINITHWTTNSIKANIDANRFFDSYIKNNIAAKSFLFYLGYYIHLFIDKEWSKRIFHPSMEKWGKDVENTVELISLIKRDWYDLDHQFLRDNGSFRTFHVFNKIQHFPNNYLDYYPVDAFEKQISFIADFYNNYSGNLNHDYLFLSKEQVSDFVEITTDKLYSLLLPKGILMK